MDPTLWVFVNLIYSPDSSQTMYQDGADRGTNFPHSNFPCAYTWLFEGGEVKRQVVSDYFVVIVLFAVFLGPCPASKKIIRKFRSRVIVLQYWTFKNTNLTPKHRRSVVLRSRVSIRKGLGLYGAPFPPKIDLCIRYSSCCILCYLTQCDIQLYVLTSWSNFSIVLGTFCFSHWHATISEGIKMFNLFMNNAMQVSTVNDKNSYLSHSVTMSL